MAGDDTVGSQIALGKAQQPECFLK